jgi:acetyl esterase
LRTLPPAVRRRLAGPPIRVDGRRSIPTCNSCSASEGSPRGADRQQHCRAAVSNSTWAVRSPAALSQPGSHREFVATIERDGPGLPCRLYTPDGVAPGSPLLVFFHGGAWVDRLSDQP